MTEAVAVPKPKTVRPALAGLVAVVFLAAFAAAFYLLGGVDLVSGVISSLFPASVAPVASTPPEAPSTPPKKPAPAAPVVVPAKGLVLPAGVDEAFAKRMYVEQLESQANIVKLVDGKVKAFDLDAASTTAGKTRVPVKVEFEDGTSAKGWLGFEQHGTAWYLVSVGSREPAEGAEDLVSPLARKPLDKDVVNTVLAQQVASQDVITAIANGSFARMTVDSVTPGEGTMTLDVTLSGPGAAAVKGHLLCISKSIGGVRTWFVTSFTKA